jgi:predicted ATPase
MTPCDVHEPKRIALTGGPGAGKTAVLAMVRAAMCDHVQVLPEAAGIVYGGGFPRDSRTTVRRAAQRAIFYVQRELEAATDDDLAIELCDRGTIDGAAYWPGPDELWASVGTTLDEQLRRYHPVLHLRTPEVGYNHDNPLRLESLAEARALDERIAALWARHPHRYEIREEVSFAAKVARAIQIISEQLPSCCRAHLPTSARSAA